MSPVQPQSIQAIAKNLASAKLIGSGKVMVSGISTDSREVSSGDLFACIPGENFDGHQYAPQALSAGAVALLAERQFPSLEADQIIVPRVRPVLPQVCELLYGLPSREMTTIGVTGTDGKTTTCFYLEHILKRADLPTAISTTIGERIGNDELHYIGRTTPEAPALQSFLRRAVDSGESYAVIEVSSHGLALGRVERLYLNGVVFTNLSRDHLDLHRDMEEYFRVKLDILRLLKSKNSFVTANMDCNYGREFLSVAAKDFPCIGFAVADGSPPTENGLTGSLSGLLLARDVRFTFGSIQARLAFGEQETELEIPALGKINLYNGLAAMSAALALGIELNKIAESMASAPAPPGRLQPVCLGQPFTVFVDYAHAPESLSKILTTVSESLSTARCIITVFGATGRRDVGKRAIMGEAVTRLSDFAIITTDDPYDEDPLEIALDIASGAEAGGAKEHEDYEIVLDRRQAIASALQRAHHGDVVIIAGKGHEPYIVTGKGKIPFRDADVAGELLREMGWGKK
jgi:UDP-N-acetylmuramoyl-L-alanyl-D-glutamate--2,6-diaminopimelate ligase